MGFYCGLDLGATHCQVCVINEAMEVRVGRKVRNELDRIIELPAPYDPAPECVVESTFNGYWLVDGLQEAGYTVSLAHCLGLRLITGGEGEDGPPGCLRPGVTLQPNEVALEWCRPFRRKKALVSQGS